MTPKSIPGSNEALLVTPNRGTIEATSCGIAWVSGAYTEPSSFNVNEVTWVSVVFLNRQKQIGERISLMALN